jgi:cysteine protease ATG4
LAGSASDLSIAATTISGSLTHGVSTAAALASSPSSNDAGKKSKAYSDDSHTSSNAKSTSKANDSAATKAGAANSKTSLLDKAVRYLLNGDASPDRSAEDSWLMGVRLPGWGRED